MKALLARAAADKLFPAINVHDELFLSWLMYQQLPFARKKAEGFPLLPCLI
jgi:hypothetical protein